MTVLTCFLLSGSLCKIRISEIEEAKFSQSLQTDSAKDALPVYDYCVWYKGCLLFYPGEPHVFEVHAEPGQTGVDRGQSPA